MANWKKRPVDLKANHNWKSKKGYHLFVADKGAIRFLFPETWIVEPAKSSIRFFNKPHPHHSSLLSVSYFNTFPVFTWRSIPLMKLFRSVVEKEGDSTARGNLVDASRPDIEIMWREYSYQDPDEQREAYRRVCLARSDEIQALLTFEFFPEEAEKSDAAWREILGSLELGKYASDAAIGDALT